jgi:hypothetical protein
VQCKVEVNGTASTYGACTGGNTSHSVSDLPEGDYTFTVRARDNVGFETTRTRSFSIDDTTVPTVLEESLWPRTGAVGVSRTTDVSATFSEAMKADSLTSTTFKLQQYNKKKKKWKTIPAELTLSNGNKTATLDPFGATEGSSEQLLAANKKYRGFITGGTNGVKDAAGNPLAASKFIWTFKTGSS